MKDKSRTVKHSDELLPVVLDLDTLPELPFEGELETVTCFRCGKPFQRAKGPYCGMPPYYWSPSVCSVQPSPMNIFVCAEKPWVDPKEKERLELRMKMHELIHYLRAFVWSK